MATVTDVQHTPEDLLRITDRPMPELIDGQFVERPPMGLKAGAIAANILFLIYGFVKAHHLGIVSGADGSFQIFPDNPKKVRIPDVSFRRREKTPQGGIEAGHGRVAPDLIVEVISPNDLAEELFGKIHDFLDAGVALIWVANPDKGDVLVIRADRTASLLRQGDILDGDDVLPGFRCPVDDLFNVEFGA
jgi:Uma2 family endonuclease